MCLRFSLLSYKEVNPMQSNARRFVSPFVLLAMVGMLYSTNVVAETPQSGTGQASQPPVTPPPAPAPKTDEESKGAPLPLHCIEGSGGIFATLTAYLVNPPSKDKIAGLPAIESTFVDVGSGKYLTAETLTENLAGRLELGYSWERFSLGELPRKLQTATGDDVTVSAMNMQNFNLRGLLVKENEFDTSWVPAVTAGIHYKYNQDWNSLNNELGGTLSAIGVTHRDGLDFTLYTTKLIKALPRPLLVSAGVRASRAAQTGLLGFTNDYHATAEANVGLFVTDHFIIAGEYREKKSDYKQVPGLVYKEHDWFTADAAYIINNRLTVGAGYGYFGEVLDHQAKGVWGIKVKWEF
jgi:hypothetical protein